MVSQKMIPLVHPHTENTEQASAVRNKELVDSGNDSEENSEENNSEIRPIGEIENDSHTPPQSDNGQPFSF